MPLPAATRLLRALSHPLSPPPDHHRAEPSGLNTGFKPPPSADIVNSADFIAIELVAFRPSISSSSSTAIPRPRAASAPPTAILARRPSSVASSSTSSSTSGHHPRGMPSGETRRRQALQWTRQEKIKRGIWAAAFAACIFVGTITGATLKQDKQKEEIDPLFPTQAITQFRAITPSEQIAILNDQKKILLDQKSALQRKIDLFHERVQERAEEKARIQQRAEERARKAK
ncbi:hypothetical protein G7046_g268 [Stylonectria norvegica]|nr:hypothetical protein G7046_g268 [Stylonectria norvegica]